MTNATKTIETLKIEKLNKTIEAFEEMNAVTSNPDAIRHLRRKIHSLITTRQGLEKKVELRKKLDALCLESSSLDHHHESATNWLHTVTTNEHYDADKKRAEYNRAHDNLMEIQDRQDALGQKIFNLQQLLNS